MAASQWTPPNPHVLQARSNAEILNAIRNEAGVDYRSRIPVATDANMELLFNRITKFAGPRNEFFDALVNRIGIQWANGVSFENPLGKFKRASMPYGSTMEEIQVGLIEAKVYDATRDYLERDNFGTEKVDVQANYHSVNRKEFYKITLNSVELRKAFLEEGGLGSLVAQIMAVPSTSNEVDEYLHMSRLFKRYADRDGFFNVNVPDVSNVDSTEANAKALLRAIRTYVDKLPFVSTFYNAAHMPTNARKTELQLFVTPEANAAMDVNALAAAFNSSFAEVGLRTTIIRQEDFGIPGVQAILTTDNFFQVADVVFENRNQQNAAGLTENYFLHVQQIISASRFVPAIMFSTNPDTPITVEDPVITSLDSIVITDRDGKVIPGTALPRGDFYQVKVNITTAPPAEDLPVLVQLAPGKTSDFTYLAQNGTFFVGNDESATKLTIVATDAATGSTVASITKDYTLTGDVAPGPWPAQPTAEPEVPDAGSGA